MLYKLLNSKKGFTLTEILVVVLIMSILVAVAVPILMVSIKTQRINDCKNQCTVIETAVRQAMYGMMDNGKKQSKITFIRSSPNGNVGCSDDEIAGVGKYFKLSADTNCFTLAELRGGYRPATIEDYNGGCDAGYYLKKKKYDEKFDGAESPVYFYTFLSNQEVPVCPFQEDNKGEPYFYYVLADGSVHCSCPECQ